jgi:hypothetical protein
MDSGSYGRDDGGDKDRLLRDYDSVIRESALLTTFTGILFGFLLTISVQSAGGFSLIDRITVLVAIFSITVAISLSLFCQLSIITYSIPIGILRNSKNASIGS